jgi:hypothetical protein
MALITTAEQDPTLAAIDSAMQRAASLEQPRGYLGASSIGQPCSRRLWYSFRWATSETFDAATLYRFDDGHRTETVLANRLRMVPGVELHTIEPTSGQQFAVVAVGGHFRGHMDGAIRGLLQAPKTWHVWEAKAVGDDKLAKLRKLKAERGEKAALAAWDDVYHAQAQVYMHYTGMTRHYLTVASPGGRVTDSVRTDYDRTVADGLEHKALRIVESPTPLAGISQDPAWYQCKMCPAANLCHRGEGVQVNCRTCVHATPELDGNARWSCARHKRDLSVDEQRAGCAEHRLIPDLIRWAKVVDANEAENWIEYETPDGGRFRNGGENGWTSAELALGPKVAELVADPVLAALRSDMGARAVA